SNFVFADGSVRLIARDTAEESNRAVREDEVRPAGVEAGEVVQAAVSIGRGVVQMAVRQHEDGSRIGAGPATGTGILLAAHNDAVGNRAGPDAVGVSPSPFADQDGRARAIGDVGNPRRAVAVEDAQSVRAIGGGLIAAHAGGIAAWGRLAAGVAEAVGHGE